MPWKDNARVWALPNISRFRAPVGVLKYYCTKIFIVSVAGATERKVLFLIVVLTNYKLDIFTSLLDSFKLLTLLLAL